MAKFDKFINNAADKIGNKGNDLIDRAEAKAKEEQAMSGDPEAKGGIKANHLASAGVGMAADSAKDKAVDKFKDKFLSNDGKDKGGDTTSSPDKLGKEGKDKNANPDKNSADEMKDKFLNKNPKTDDLLSKNQNPKAAQAGKNSLPANGKQGKQGNNPLKGKESAGDKSEKKNAFGDTKKADNKHGNGLKKDPKVGSNTGGLAKDAVKDGAKGAVKDGAKDAAKDVAKEGAQSIGKEVAGGDAGAVKDVAKNIADGDMDAATDKIIEKGVEKGAEAAANYFAPGSGKFAGKLAGLATKFGLKTEAGKLLKAVCCFCCLGIIFMALAPILAIPVLISYILKTISDIIESIPIVGSFIGWLQDELCEALGFEGFGDFELEEIGEDSSKHEEYAKFKDRFMAARVNINSLAVPQNNVNTVCTWTKDDEIADFYQSQTTFNPEALVSDYLPVYKVFAALEAVDKDELAWQLEAYFMYSAEYDFTTKEDITVTYETKPRVYYVPDGNGGYSEIIRYEEQRIETRTTKLILTKATTLNEILTFEPVKTVDGENVYWEQGEAQVTPNTVVIAMFNQYDWEKSEISVFEYIADCNPIVSLYDAGMYGFTSEFTMPIDDYKIAIPYVEGAHPYIEIPGNKDTQVKAIADGKVEDIGSDYIILKIGDGVKVKYSSLRINDNPSLNVGDSVTQAQVIGYMLEPTIIMEDSFLKIQVTDKNGKHIDPQEFLKSKIIEAIDYNSNGEYSMKSYKQYDYSPVAGISVKKAGCGPTAFAMVLSRYGRGDVTPTQVASLAHSKGLWSGDGATTTMFNKLAPEYGITNFTEVGWITTEARNYAKAGTSSAKINKILKAIGENKPVVMLIYGVNRTGEKTKFTTGGHYIVVDGTWPDGTAKVLDPVHESDKCKWANIKAGKDSEDHLFRGARWAMIFN